MATTTNSYYLSYKSAYNHINQIETMWENDILPLFMNFATYKGLEKKWDTHLL